MGCAGPVLHLLRHPCSGTIVLHVDHDSAPAPLSAHLARLLWPWRRLREGGMHPRRLRHHECEAVDEGGAGDRPPRLHVAQIHHGVNREKQLLRSPKAASLAEEVALIDMLVAI